MAFSLPPMAGLCAFPTAARGSLRPATSSSSLSNPTGACSSSPSSPIPNVAYILLLVGIYGILFEFMSPGTIFSGVIGAICLLIALFALNLLPINYAGIGLMLLGIALMVAEVFSPSFGILGIGGIIALALGSL